MKIISHESVPKGTIFLVPEVTFERYLNISTGDIKEYFKYDPKAAGIITNIGVPGEDRTRDPLV